MAGLLLGGLAGGAWPVRPRCTSPAARNLRVGIGLDAADVDEWLGLLGEVMQEADHLDVLAD